MTKTQTIRNMDLIVSKISRNTNVQLGLVEYESTQEVKTLINTYGTLLGDIKRLSSEEFKEIGIVTDLLNHKETFEKSSNIIEEDIIPAQLLKCNYKASDNLATTNSKIKSIVRDITWMTDGLDIRKAESFKANKEIIELLDLSITTGTLIVQNNENIRATGKTVSIIKKAHELNCAILTLNKTMMNYTNHLAKEMGLYVTIIPASDWKALVLPQYRKQVENGFIVDEVRDLNLIKKLSNKGYKILGGFSALTNSDTVGIEERLIKLCNERDVINATYMDEAVHKPEWIIVNAKIEIMKEIIEKLKK